jgi:hypothetical protein
MRTPTERGCCRSRASGAIVAMWLFLLSSSFFSLFFLQKMGCPVGACNGLRRLRHYAIVFISHSDICVAVDCDWGNLA